MAGVSASSLGHLPASKASRWGWPHLNFKGTRLGRNGPLKEKTIIRRVMDAGQVKTTNSHHLSPHTQGQCYHPFLPPDASTVARSSGQALNSLEIQDRFSAMSQALPVRFKSQNRKQVLISSPLAKPNRKPFLLVLG